MKVCRCWQDSVVRCCSFGCFYSWHLFLEFSAGRTDGYAGVNNCRNVYSLMMSSCVICSPFQMINTHTHTFTSLPWQQSVTSGTWVWEHLSAVADVSILSHTPSFPLHTLLNEHTHRHTHTLTHMRSCCIQSSAESSKRTVIMLAWQRLSRNHKETVQIT